MTAIPSSVAVVLVNWNSWRDSVECLSSLLASDSAAFFHIFIVDNDSTDNSVEHIATWCDTPTSAMAYKAFDGVRHINAAPVVCRVWQANGQAAPAAGNHQVTVVRAGGNLGFAGGNNVGITAAGLHRYTHFWLLNTDTVIRHDALACLLRRAAALPAVDMIGSTLLYYDDPGQVQAMGGGEIDPHTVVGSHVGIGARAQDVPVNPEIRAAIESRFDYIVGASMLVTTPFINRVGLMCEDYFLYFEEADWALRGGEACKLGYAPDSVVYHKVGASSEDVVSAFSQRLFYRNRIRFVGRYFPDRARAALWHMAVDVLRHGVRGRFSRCRQILAALLQAPRLLRG